ncbi:saccharopine dehydrogenase family protein [Gemmatimonadota bacterium]
MRAYAVLGAGLMGRAVAKDLLRSETDASVTLMDFREDVLEGVAKEIAQERLRTESLDIRNRAASAEKLKGHSAVVAALPHAQSMAGLEAAITAGVPIVDLVGSRPELKRGLDREAREAGVLVLPGLGVAPGLSNVLVARGVEALNETHEAVIYVGGIPRRRRPPLEYETVYSLVSMFGAVSRPARMWRNGLETTAEPMTGLELLDFPEPIGSLEAYYTDGLASLALTMPGRVRDNLEEKTLRYPGFADRVGFLKSCGLLDDSAVDLEGVAVVPRDLLIGVLTPKLTLGPEGDILVMRVVVRGDAEGQARTHTFDLFDFMDPASGETAMARTTGFPAAIAARMMARGQIMERGVRFPEELFGSELGDELLSELAARGVQVTHRVEIT